MRNLYRLRRAGAEIADLFRARDPGGELEKDYVSPGREGCLAHRLRKRWNWRWRSRANCLLLTGNEPNRFKLLGETNWLS